MDPMFNFTVSLQAPLDKQENQIPGMAEQRHSIACIILKAPPINTQLPLERWKGWGRMEWGIDWRRWLLTLIFVTLLKPN
jgi:hypothetical protein